MPSESEKIEIGSVIAKRYTIEKCLGTGGMGAVYLAEDSFLNGDKVALKILHPDLVVDTKQSQRFMREVQLMRKVDHVNVVRTFDVGSDGEIVFFTMEYVPGKSLEAYIEGQSFPKDQITNLIIGVASGLQAIHKVNIIHRDLKPANILLPESFQPKITDFGVARPEYSELTAHNEIIGSALYIAPEVWIGTKLTSSVDLYSFGVVLYELTTGVLPFDGDSPATLMRMHLEFKPTAPKELNPDIPVWLNKLILKLLEKTPEERLRNAEELIDYVETQTNAGKKKVFTEDKFISELEIAASQLDSGKEKIPEFKNKPIAAMTYGQVREKPKRSFKEEILASFICLLIGGVTYLVISLGLNFIQSVIYSELSITAADPAKWNFESLSSLSLAPGFLLLITLKAIFGGAGLFLPLGAATGSLKSTIKLYLSGLIWCSVIVLIYLIFGLTNTTEKHLLLSNPDGFSLLLSSIRCALASTMIDSKIWVIQKVIFEQGIVFYPEVSSPLGYKLATCLQSVPIFALALLTCKLARISNWILFGIILGLITTILYYFIGGVETHSLFEHSYPMGLAVIMLVYSTLILFKRLSSPKAAQRS